MLSLAQCFALFLSYKVCSASLTETSFHAGQILFVSYMCEQIQLGYAGNTLCLYEIIAWYIFQNDRASRSQALLSSK